MREENRLDPEPVQCLHELFVLLHGQLEVRRTREVQPLPLAVDFGLTGERVPGTHEHDPAEGTHVGLGGAL